MVRLLDSIGKATNTIDAANNGITSLTTLVQSAKSIAQQARQATGATSTYSSLDASSNILSSTNLNGSESVATFTGANTAVRKNELEAKTISISGAAVVGENIATDTGVNTAALGNRLDAQAIAFAGATITETKATASATTAKTDGALTGTPPTGTVRVAVSTRNGAVANFDVALIAADDTQAEVISRFAATTSTVNGVAGTRLDSLVNVTFDAGDHLTLTAITASTDFTILNNANSGGTTTDVALTNLGLTGTEVNSTKNSSSLFDQMLTNDATIQGKNFF